MPERQAGQHARLFEFAQSGGEDVGGHSEVTLQITVALWSVEEPAHDEQGPPGADDIEGGGEVAHSCGPASGFIQNGE